MNQLARDAAADQPALIARRDFLKVGAGFSLALTVAAALPGCGDAPKTPAQGLTFLLPADVELFSAIAPVVLLDLARRDSAQRQVLARQTIANIDVTCAGLDLGSRGELRKLLDLLAIGPLRYALTGVGAWNGASAESLTAFLERWRGSRFATLNAGGIILVKLVAASYYVIPETFASTGYPGPYAPMFDAINS
ncbi:MAG TPA: hypothetical protein PL196_11560 [Burkholderiaceae bacterium]|nr:hypothetical protein [Burkholderiaceae bacterium]